MKQNREALEGVRPPNPHARLKANYIMKKSNLIRTIILASSLLLQLSTLCFHSTGAAGDVDLSFDPGSGVNGTVTAIAVQPDGKVIIGGGFTTVKGLARPGIARLNTDGSGDSSFSVAGYGTVGALALQSDGKVLVGHYSGITRHHSDGSLDTSFNANLYSEYSVYDVYVSSIAVQPDGKLLVGGNLATVGTEVNYGITRLNADGSMDTNFNVGSFSTYGYDTVILSIAVQSDGKVLVSGYLATANGTNVTSGIARLNSNGSLDNSFNSGTGANDHVHSVTVQSDGKVLIGGSFTDFNGTPRNSIARLNANGSLDLTFNPGTGVVPNSYSMVNSLVVQSDGKVLIGGSFITVNGTNRNRMARLNADGSLDNGFYPGRGLEYPAYSLKVQPDGKVLVNTVRLNMDGSLDDTYVFVPNTNFNANIDVPGTDYSAAQCSAVQPDGKVLLGGNTGTTIDVDEFGNHYYSFGCFVTRVNADGSRDTNFNLVVGGYGTGYYWELWRPTVRALAVQPDGKILVSGLFRMFGGTNRNGIARLNANGTLDSSFNPGFGGDVYSMLLQPDGRVLLGSSAGLAWLNSDGSRDPCFNPTIAYSGYANVLVAVLQPDGRVLIGGSFSAVNGVSRNGIARLNGNGSLDSSFDPGSGANATVRAIALQPDGNVLIGGDFLTVNGVTRPYVARLFGGSSGPRLRVFSTSNSAAIVAWPSPSAGFTLQQNTNLVAPNWVNVATTPATVGLENRVTVSPPTGQRFFRLSSDAVSTPPPPPGPAPTVTAIAGDGRVSLSWTTVLGATGHHIQRATNYNGPYTTIAHPSTASYTDTTAINGTTYYYIVSLIYPCGEGANSFPVGSTPQAAPTVHVQSITLSFVAQGSHYNTRAVVKVVDNTGTPFSGATVTGNFTGSINNAGRTGVTSANGDAIITSSSSIRNGTVTFTVTGVVTGTFGYNPGANVVSSATITR
jgi:uncharacterized delta-60 repeat protein